MSLHPKISFTQLPTLKFPKANKNATPLSIFHNDWGAEPKTWGVILLDTMAYSKRGRAHIVTDSHFC